MESSKSPCGGSPSSSPSLLDSVLTSSFLFPPTDGNLRMFQEQDSPASVCGDGADLILLQSRQYENDENANASGALVSGLSGDETSLKVDSNSHGIRGQQQQRHHQDFLSFYQYQQQQERQLQHQDQEHFHSEIMAQEQQQQQQQLEPAQQQQPLLSRSTVFSSTSTGDESSAWFHSSVSELSPCLDGTSDANNNNVDDDFDDNDDVFADAPDVCHDDVSNYQHLVNQSRHIIAGAATTVAAAAAATGGGGSGNGDQLSLLSAARESVRCGRLTPLLKMELKYLIQARRMSEGKDEMEVSFEPRADAQLSASELERVERRRRQNRAAAKKFREKRKSTEESLLKNIQELQETNSRLVEQAKQLRHEKQLLMEIVAEHLLVCPHLGQLPVDIIGGDSVP